MNTKLVKFGKLIALGAVLTTSAFADGLDTSTIVLDMEPIYTLTGTILVGLSAIWGIRKLIKLVNRS